jgi:outer membrane receptor protein involved in Fe transport
MKKFLIPLLIVQTFTAFSTEVDKPDNSNKKGDISGIIIDSNNGLPVEYATIAVYTQPEEKLLTGGITDNQGEFRLKNNPVGTYYLIVTFMGYKSITLNDIKILPDTREVDLGRIALERNVKELEAVNVVADQSSVQYKIDKKVINVGQNLTSISGTAVDILENVPSVKVDIDGNVTLRGSGSFTVLIDGRPTVLEPSDALAQIPAGAIENIEIITNPSAKYEPDGAAGIINIVTKQNKLQGTSGIVNASVGRFENYGGDFTLDTRKNKFHYYIGGDYNVRGREGEMEYERIFFNPDSNNYNILSDGYFERSNERYSIKGGLDWDFTPKDVIGFNLRVGDGTNNNVTIKNYEEFFDIAANHDYYITDDKGSRGGSFFESNINYKHIFNKEKTHYVEAQVIADGRNSTEESENIRRFLNDSIASAKRSTEDGPSSGLRLKLDYTKPFNWGGKLEAGWQSQFSKSDDYNKVYDYDTLTREFVFQDLYSNHTMYNINTHAAYSTFGGEFGDFGYQAGLRLEYTYQYLELVEKGDNFLVDRPDFFPTLHFSYKMPAEQQAMVSYTRRIERPRGWNLEPFITYMDAYNVRTGNPELLPEYINSFDLSYQKKFQKSNFYSVEGYYRITENKVERVPGPYADDTTNTMFLHTVANVGTDYALGVEFMLNYSPTKWYTANLMADLYDYRLTGEYNDRNFEQHDFSWNSRFNNTFKVGQNSRIQIDFMYQSDKVQAQGRSIGFFSSNMAYKQDLFKKKLSATVQVRDVFGTVNHENILQGADFYQYTQFKPKSPMVMLTLSYKLNIYRANKPENGIGGGGDEGGDIMYNF